MHSVLLCAPPLSLAGRTWQGGGIKGVVHPFPDQSLWVSSCVCKDDEVGDGHACYGHLLHEIRRANQNGLVLLWLRVAIAMLGVYPLGLPVTMPPAPYPQSWEGDLVSAETLVSLPMNWMRPGWRWGLVPALMSPSHARHLDPLPQELPSEF